jgi:hypothetical protein
LTHGACAGDLTSAPPTADPPNRLRFPRAKPNPASRTCAAQFKLSSPPSHSSPLPLLPTVGSTTPTRWKPCSRAPVNNCRIPTPKKCRGTAPAHAPLYSCRARARPSSLILEGGGDAGPPRMAVSSSPSCRPTPGFEASLSLLRRRRRSFRLRLGGMVAELVDSHSPLGF